MARKKIPLKTVQEADFPPAPPSLPPGIKEERYVFFVKKLLTRFTINGEEVEVRSDPKGIVGYTAVFEDKEKAITFADGDESLVMTCKRLG